MTEKIIERIRKLLRMARDKGASEAEASLAMKKASQLILEHNIQEHELDEDSKPRIGLHNEIYDNDEEWVYHAAYAASVIYQCSTFISKGEGIKIIGLPLNRQAAYETLSWLVDQIEDEYKKALPRGLSKQARADFRRTFKLAASHCLRTRAEEIVEQNKLHSKALLVIENTKEAADKFAREKFNVRTAIRRQRRIGLGTIEGALAGDRIKLNERMSK